MEARDKHITKTNIDKDYINEINWDRLCFRSLKILAAILIVGILIYFFWFMG